MRLQLMSWPEVERYLEGSEGMIVPIGATEQHGPTGLIGTDAICAETLAWGVGDVTGAVVAPTLAIGMSVHHMAFPGSVTLRPSTLLKVVRDTVLSLAEHGFRRFWFVNGHGGNTATLHAAFFEVYGAAKRLFGEGGRLRCATQAWWEVPAAKRLSGELFGDRDGDHATASEVSLALYAHPDHVKEARLAAEAPASSHVFGPEDFRRRYPEGRMGSDPSLASAGHGARIFEAVVADLAVGYREFIADP